MLDPLVADGGRRRPSEPPSWVLTILGSSLLLIAAIGLFTGANVYLVGGFLLLGVVLVVISAVVPRLEGKQEFKLTGASLSLGKLGRSIENAEKEIEQGKLPELDDLVGSIEDD